MYKCSLNYGVRFASDFYISLPKSKTNQAKFACGIATLWLVIIIYLFQHSLFTWGYVIGGILFVIAFLVST